MFRPISWMLLSLLATCSGACVSSATEPNVRAVSIRGLQIGGTTTLTIEGDDLIPTPKLLLPFPAVQLLKPNSSDRSATFDVTLGDRVVPGLYHLRVATDHGVSLPAIIGVDRLPQVSLTKGLDRLPIAAHGSLSGSTVVETTFHGNAGQHVLIEVEAQRLGSALRPVIHLYGPSRRQVAWAWGVPTLLGDARLDTTLPLDGTYTVTVHDVEYAGPASGFFRLKLGAFAAVDQVFPPVVVAGGTSVELLGPTAPRSTPWPPIRGHWRPLAWPAGDIWTGPRPAVEVSDRAEFVEPVAELPSGSVGVSGKLHAEFEEDAYHVPVTPGMKVRFEVIAERLRSPIDAALVLRDGAGTELARSEDSPGTLDPAIEFTAPPKLTTVRVCVVDAHGQGGPRAIYRLIVDPIATARSDFYLFTSSARVTVPAGGTTVVPIIAERRGYSGTIRVEAIGLPTGTRLDETTIPADADGTLVVVRHIGEPQPAMIGRWAGHGDAGQERTVIVRDHPLERLQPWLAEEIAVSPVAPDSRIAIDWRTLPTDAPLVPGLKRVLPVRVTRLDPNHPVRLSLLTSQNVPLTNGRPDLNRAIRVEKGIELLPKVAEGDLSLVVPPELASPVYDIAVQAELLTTDRKTVLATAYTPVRRMTVRYPAAVMLTGPTNLSTGLDPKTGATVVVAGTVDRVGGVFGDVTVRLTGLPPGARADAVTVKALADTFAVQLVLPPTTPPGVIAGLKLSASVIPDPSQPGVRVKSRDVELQLTVSKPK